MTTTLTAPDTLLRFRDRFPILKRTKYLVSHSLGAMPEATKDALEEYADLWASRGVRAWGDKWWMMSIEVGDIIAPLIGAPPGSVVMLPNVTTAEAVVLSSFDYKPPPSGALDLLKIKVPDTSSGSVTGSTYSLRMSVTASVNSSKGGLPSDLRPASTPRAYSINNRRPSSLPASTTRRATSRKRWTRSRRSSGQQGGP